MVATVPAEGDRYLLCEITKRAVRVWFLWYGAQLTVES